MLRQVCFLLYLVCFMLGPENVAASSEPLIMRENYLNVRYVFEGALDIDIASRKTYWTEIAKVHENGMTINRAIVLRVRLRPDADYSMTDLLAIIASKLGLEPDILTQHEGLSRLEFEDSITKKGDELVGKWLNVIAL